MYTHIYTRPYIWGAPGNREQNILQRKIEKIVKFSKKYVRMFNLGKKKKKENLIQ